MAGSIAGGLAVRRATSTARCGAAVAAADRMRTTAIVLLLTLASCATRTGKIAGIVAGVSAIVAEAHHASRPAAQGVVHGASTTAPVRPAVNTFDGGKPNMRWN